jgi:cytochrome bd-type quinol oxidase subunit 2
MRWWWQQNLEYAAQKRREENLGSSGHDLDRKYWIALLLYGVLAVLVWFTVGEGKIFVFGKHVELRLIPILILATFALRTVLVRQADKIRHGGE